MAEKTGIEELRLTTRDISDYDVLMKKRLGILKAHGLKLPDITRVIGTMDPLDGAVEFLEWLRSRVQVIILSDTFVEFAGPLMRKLAWPVRSRRRPRSSRMALSARTRPSLRVRRALIPCRIHFSSSARRLSNRAFSLSSAASC